MTHNQGSKKSDSLQVSTCLPGQHSSYSFVNLLHIGVLIQIITIMKTLFKKSIVEVLLIFQASKQILWAGRGGDITSSAL